MSRTRFQVAALFLALVLTGATPAPLAAPQDSPMLHSQSPDVTTSRPSYTNATVLGASACETCRDDREMVAADRTLDAPSFIPAGGAPQAAPSGNIGTALMAGNIGWAEPDLGTDYLATRFPRGTLVEICGPNACLIRRTNDYGPVASIRPNRIADLAVLDWEYITGLPRSRGIAPGTIETVAEIALPPTDTLP